MKRDLDRFDSPWTPPAAETLEVRPTAEAWADGRVIMLRPGCDLPARCVVCNTPAQVTMSKKRLTWHHPGWFLLILVNLIVYFIVSLLVRRSARVQVGMCATHRKQRRNRVLAGVGVTGLGVLVSILLLDQGGLMLILAIAFTIFALLLTFYLGQSVHAVGIDKDWIRIKGAGDAFLDGLPRARR